MKTTIKDCMALPAFENAKVLANKDKINESVKKISVLEATRVEDLDKYKAERNQMFFTGFYGIRDNAKEQCEIIKRLSELEVSALVIHSVGEIVSEIAEEVISKCEELGIVLIALSNGKNNIIPDVIDEISHMIFYGVNDRFDNNLITDSIFHLLNFDKYQDFPSAVKAAALSNRFQMVLLSSDFNPVLTVETQHKTTVDKAIRLGREKAVEKRASVYTMIDVDGVLTYWGPITVAGSLYYMFIVDNEDSYSTDEIIKLADVIEISMGMWRYTPIKDQKAEFIKALKRGNLSMAYSLKDEAGVQEENIVSVFLGNGYGAGEIQVLIDEYCTLHNLTSLQIIEGDEIFGIIIGDCSTSTCAKLYDYAKTARKTKMFHVTGVDGVEGACDAFKLINETWNLAQLVFPFKRAFSKYDLALVSNCNNIQLRGGFIKRNYLKLLEPFEADTSQKGRQLLDTLEKFVLDAGMNGAKTAEIMEVHTNTVQYRLKKISEILGAEITGNRVIPGLTIALALKRLERV